MATNLVVVVVIGLAGTIIEAVADSQGLVAVDPETNEIEPTGIFGVILAILGLVNLWIIYALGAKRLHERDRTGWWLAVPLIALIVGIVLASMALSLPEGGPDPKAGKSTREP